MEPIESLPADLEGLHRGLLWVAREVAEYERALRRATDEMGALGGRLGGLEVREQALVRAAQGVEEFRRELAWVTAEVRARGQVLAAATEKLDDLADSLKAVRADNENEVGALRLELSAIDPVAVRALVEGEVDRVAGEAVMRLDRAAAEPRADLLERLGRAESALVELDRRQADHDDLQAVTVTEDRLGPILDRLAELERWAEATGQREEERATTLESALGEVRRSATESGEEVGGIRSVLAGLERRTAQGEERLVNLGAEDRLAAAESALAGLGSRADELAQAQRSAVTADRVDRLEEALMAQGATVEEMPEQLGAMRHRVDELAGEVASVDTSIAAAVAQEAGPLHQAIDELRWRVEQVGSEAILAGDAAAEVLSSQLAAIHGRIDGYEPLAAAVAGASQEIDRLVETAAHRNQMLAALDQRTEPLEGAIDELQGDMSRLAAEVTAQHQSALWSMQTRVDELSARLTAMEEVPGDLGEVRLQIEQMHTEVEGARQAALAATTEQLGALARLRSLESMPTDLEDVYRELERVSEMAAAAAEAGLARLAEKVAPLEAETAELRAGVDRLGLELGMSLQAASVASSREIESFETRVRALESQAAEVTRLAAELERHDVEVVATRGELAEQVSALAGRLARLDAMPTDIEALYRELDRIVEVTNNRHAEVAAAAGPATARLEQLRAELESVESRVLAVETLPEAVATLRGDLSPLVQQVADLGGTVAGVPVKIEDLHREVALFASDLDDARAGTNRSLAELAESVRALEALPAALATLERSVDDVADMASADAGGTAILRARLETVATDAVAAARSVLEETAARVDALAERIGPLEDRSRELTAGRDSVADSLEDLRRRLDRAGEDLERERLDREQALVRLDALESGLRAVESIAVDVERWRQDMAAARADDDEKAAVEARVRALEALPDRVADLQRDLESSIQRLANEHGNLAAVAGPDGPLGDALVGLRAELDHVRAELRTAQGGLVSDLDAVERSMVGLRERAVDGGDLEGLVEAVRSEIRSVRDEARGSAGGVAERLERLEELSSEVSDLRQAVAALPATAFSGPPGTEFRDRLERLVDDIATTQREVFVTTTRLDRFDHLPEEVGTVQRRFDELAAARASDAAALDALRNRLDQVAIRNVDPGALDALRDRLDQVAARAADAAGLDQLRDRLDQVAIRNVDPGALDALRDRLDEVARRAVEPAVIEQLRIRLDQVTAHAVEPTVVEQLRIRLDQVVARAASWPEDSRSLSARIDELEGLPVLVAGIGRLLQRAAARGVLDGGLVTAVEQRLEQGVADAVRASAEGAAEAAEARRELAALADRIGPLESLEVLPGQVIRAHEELRTVREELDAVRQAGLVDLATRTSPLADAVAEVQNGLRRLLEESVAVREALRAGAGGLDALDERTRALEDLPAEVRKIDTVLTRLDRDVITAQQAALAATTYRLAEIDAQLRTFESLRADVDGLYGALHRVAEEVGLPAERDGG